VVPLYPRREGSALMPSLLYFENGDARVDIVVERLPDGQPWWSWAVAIDEIGVHFPVTVEGKPHPAPDPQAARQIEVVLDGPGIRMTVEIAVALRASVDRDTRRYGKLLDY
jgi:hypothetical protein